MDINVNLIETLENQKEGYLAEVANLKARLKQVEMNIHAVDLKITAAKMEQGTYVPPQDRLLEEMKRASEQALKSSQNVFNMVKGYVATKVSEVIAENAETEEEVVANTEAEAVAEEAVEETEMNWDNMENTTVAEEVEETTETTEE